MAHVLFKPAVVAASSRIIGLDIARSLAVICVVGSHTIYLLGAHPIMALLKGYCGFYGVEIFFVLSGYLIGRILLLDFDTKGKGLATIRSFWKRRWYRTLPNYYLALAVYTLMLLIVQHRFVFADWHFLAFFGFGQNLINRHPGFFAVAWSLSVEEWFYLMLPLWLRYSTMLFRRGKNSVVYAALSWILLVTLLRAVVCYHGVALWDDDVRKIVPLRLDSLMFGVVIGYCSLYYKEWLQRSRSLLCGIGIVLFACSSLLFYSNFLRTGSSPSFVALLFIFPLTSIAFALMLPLAASYTPASPSLLLRAIMHLSIISYSLYLFHDVVISLLDTVGFSDTRLQCILVWLIAILLSSVVYRYYEKPITALRDKAC